MQLGDGSIQARNQCGQRPPCKLFRSPWKIVMEIV